MAEGVLIGIVIGFGAGVLVTVGIGMMMEIGRASCRERV